MIKRKLENNRADVISETHEPYFHWYTNTWDDMFVFEGRGNKHGNKINKKAKLSSCHITHEFLWQMKVDLCISVTLYGCQYAMAWINS